jgi:hypothetical protein
MAFGKKSLRLNSVEGINASDLSESPRQTNDNFASCRSFDCARAMRKQPLHTMSASERPEKTARMMRGIGDDA